MGVNQYLKIYADDDDGHWENSLIKIAFFFIIQVKVVNYSKDNDSRISILMNILRDFKNFLINFIKDYHLKIN